MHLLREVRDLCRRSRFLLRLGVVCSAILYIGAYALLHVETDMEHYFYLRHTGQSVLEIAPAVFVVCVICSVIIDLVLRDQERKKEK